MITTKKISIEDTQKKINMNHYILLLRPVSLFQPNLQVPRSHLSHLHFIDKEPEALGRKGTQPGVFREIVAQPWLDSISPGSQLGVPVIFLVTNLGNIQLSKEATEKQSVVRGLGGGGQGGQSLKLVSNRHRSPILTGFCAYFVSIMETVSIHYRNF